MDRAHTIVIINPGSTSTKIAVAKDDVIAQIETLHHHAAELRRFTSVWEQFPYRLRLSSEWVRAHVERCSAIVARGGLLRSLEGGTYTVSEKMLADARANLQGEHAANLGCALAWELAAAFTCSAYIVDPVSVDEFEPPARYSGLPQIERRSLSHALSIHAAGRRAAEEMGLQFSRSNFVICHLGGGISVAPLRGGRIIDVNDAASDGPFSPDGSGGLPLQKFITLCFSGSHTEKELRELVRGKGGLIAYLGTNDLKEVERRIDAGDNNARGVLEAMTYQIAKEIGAMSTVLHGNVDAIVLTGGAARSAQLTRRIEERVGFIAPVRIFAGDDEMGALARGALRVLKGEEAAKAY